MYPYNAVFCRNDSDDKENKGESTFDLKEWRDKKVGPKYTQKKLRKFQT